MPKSLFHLAFPVTDLKAARHFYETGLGCRIGRVSRRSMILNLAGHQIVAQRVSGAIPEQRGIYPRHFGLVFANLHDWEKMAARARRKRLKFYQEPRVRFEKTAIEHRTFFLKDPSNNLLEFKYYTKPSAVFGQRTFNRVGDQAS